MSHHNKIPCTIAILTRNSGNTLPATLVLTEQFAEILICDGRSTDDTLSIAEKVGAKVINQSSEFMDDKGRLVDYSGVRNQLLQEAKYDWQFHLDSDEMLTEELVSEIRQIIKKHDLQSFIYLVPRKYYLNETVIDCAVNYPSYQYRFYNRKHVTFFTKKVHERIRFSDTESVCKLKSCQLVPVRFTPEEAWQKLIHYIEMESSSDSPKTLLKKIMFLKEQLRRIASFFIRFLISRLLCRGKKLPLKYEISILRYHILLLKQSWRN